VFNPNKNGLFFVRDLGEIGEESPGGMLLLFEPWHYSVKGSHEDMMTASLVLLLPSQI